MTVQEIKTTEPNPQMVEQCQKMLDDAVTGELQGCIGIVVYQTGNCAEFWVPAPKGYHINLVSDRILGCLERIKYQLLSKRFGVDAEDSWGDGA